jgi:hypothetical protein
VHIFVGICGDAVTTNLARIPRLMILILFSSIFMVLIIINDVLFIKLVKLDSPKKNQFQVGVTA